MSIFKFIVHLKSMYDIIYFQGDEINEFKYSFS